MAAMGTFGEGSFIDLFHSLSGTTVGERRKSLFLLLRETSRSISASNIDFSVLLTRNPLEENFKVEALIYFRRVPELLQVLKDGNPILIQKVLNVSSWFVKAAFKNMSGEELAENCFPCFSYKTKLKLLNKLSLHLKNPKKAEEFFKAVEKKYGLYVAWKLFPACSDFFIVKLIVANRMEVTPGQLLRVAKRCSYLIINILNTLDQRNSKIKLPIKYENVFRHLLMTNSNIFDDIQEQYCPEVLLGARATKSFVRNHKESFVQDPKKFYYYLRPKQLGRSLKEDFEMFYTNIFPKSLKYFSDNSEEYIDLLRHIPSNSKKLELLLRVFKKQFGKELWECPAIVTPKLIEMMSPDDRNYWIQTQERPEDIAEAQWISYMKTEKSLPWLKENVSCTPDINERAALISCLVRTCLINDDKSALLDVCKYAARKHRNDKADVRLEFIRALHYSKYLAKLDIEHWKHIIDLIRVAQVNGEEEWICKDIFIKYIHFCLNMKLPIRELLVEYTKYKYISYNFICKNMIHEKTCLLMFAEIILNYRDNVSVEHFKDMHIHFLVSLDSWNRRFPDYKLSLFMYDRSIEYLKLNLQNKEHPHTELHVILKCVRFDHKKSDEEDLLRLFFECKNKSWYLCRDMINLLLKYHPSLFVKHIFIIMDEVKHFAGYKNRLNSSLYRYYSHLGIPEDISVYLHHCIKFEVMRKHAIMVLSHLMDPEMFINETAKHYPINLTADVSTPKKRDTYKYQKAFMQFLKNVIPPSWALHSVFRFCKGDYLSGVQSSLHSLCVSVPENQLVPFYNILLDRPVSVKKSAICLAFNTLDGISIKHFVAKLVSEEHASIGNTLYKATFDYFLKNPNDYTWEMAESIMNVVDFNAKEVVAILTMRKWIPYSYFQQYVLLVWGACEERGTPEGKATEGKEHILELFNSINIVTLPVEFFQKVFERYLFKSKKPTSFDIKVQSLACKYLIYYKGQERSKRMELIFGIFKTYVHSNWYNLATSLVCRQCSVNFVKEFCTDFLNKKYDDQDVLVDFIAQWSTVFEPHHVLFEYLYLQFTLICLYRSQKKLNMSQLGERLVQLYNNVADDMLGVIGVFCECFDVFNEHLLEMEKRKLQEENIYNLLDSIIHADRSENVLMLIISLLPTEKVVIPDIKCIYDKIMETLLNQKSRSVQIYLNCYLSKLPLPLEQKPSVVSWSYL